MSDLTTPVLLLVKPEVNSSLDTWGDKTNANWDKVDTAYNNKANVAHTHTMAQIAGLDTALAGKAPTIHTHTTAQIAGLDGALAAKAPLTSPALTGAPTAPTAARDTNTTQIATMAAVVDAVGHSTEGAKAGSYTLVAADKGKTITFSVAGNLTVPGVFLAGDRVDIIQYGTGQVTVVGSGVTIRCYAGHNKTAGQYAGATLWFKGPTEAILIGNLA